MTRSAPTWSPIWKPSRSNLPTPRGRDEGAAQVNCAGGTSDGRFIIEVCAEVAEFGPVNRSIHKVNEAVALDEIEPLAQVYRLAVEDLLLAR